MGAGNAPLARLWALAAASALVLAACGDGSPSFTASEPTVTVAALGDSITSGSPGYDPDPAQRSALGFGDDPRSQYEYWAERADPALEVRNCGVFGERTDEIAARLDDCVAGADAVVVQGGINDLAQGYPAVQAADELAAMVARAQQRGLDVYLANVLPWNKGHPRFDGPIHELNHLIEKIGEDDRVPVLDFHDALADPANPELMPPGLTADRSHPSVEGYRRLGELVARRVARSSDSSGSASP